MRIAQNEKFIPGASATRLLSKRFRPRQRPLSILGRSIHRCDLTAGVNVPAETSLRPSRELGSRRVLLSYRTNHAAMSFSRLLAERSMSSGGSIQAVRLSSRAVIRQHDSAALNRESCPRHTALHGPHGSGWTGNPNSRPRSEFSALASRSARFSPNTLLVRAWRSLIELRIDAGLATVAQFEDEMARADAPVAPRLREFAEVLRAVLLVLKSQDGATVRAALAVFESRHQSGGRSPALAAALRVGYWKVRDFDRYYAVPRLNHAASISAAYASGRALPHAHARLTSGWWLAFTGWESNPLDSIEKFPSVTSNFLLSQVYPGANTILLPRPCSLYRA